MFTAVQPASSSSIRERLIAGPAHISQRLLLRFLKTEFPGCFSSVVLRRLESEGRWPKPLSIGRRLAYSRDELVAALDQLRADRAADVPVRQPA